ncbi:MAG TPA: hypothetical protein VFQ24_10225 [Terriglobia bacterium]|nr:hypothetical protein [Terriglobia bacterium]
MKRMWLTIIVVFLVFTALSYVIHGVLLQPLYQQSPLMLRTQQDAQSHFPFMLLAFLVFSVAFVWIYSRGLEPKPWLGQGLRYGAAVWLIASVSRYLIYFAVQPWSGSVMALQIGLELIMMLLVGITAAALYRKAA